MSRRRGTALGVLAALVTVACGTAGGGGAATAAGAGAGAGEAAEDPIVVGGTLSLTGALAPTAAIHQVAGELFVEELNAAGGLLGRPVEWRLLDDESAPDRAAALYERLITEEGVDLLMGPYGTGTVSAVMPVAERYGYAFPQHTGSLTYAYEYGCQFPTWATGLTPNETSPATVFDALEAGGTPPGTVAFVTNQFPGTMFVSYGQPDTDQRGAVDVAAERGYEVVLDVQYPLSISDWGPIAAQIRDADPDLLWIGGVGIDAPNLLTALQQIGHRPPQTFVMWPSPGPLLALGEGGQNVLSVTLFEPNGPQADDPAITEITTAFSEQAEAAGLPYTVFETQAATSWTAWEALVAGVEGSGGLDQQAICDHLVDNGVDSTFLGDVRFDPEQNNYYGDRQMVKQLQGDDWVVVHPDEFAAAELQS